MAVNQAEPATEKTPSEVIFYEGRIFEVPSKTLWDFAHAPENLRERIRLAGEWGLGGMTSEGGIGCWYCNHYQANIANVFNSASKEKCIIMNATGTPGMSVDGCLYDGNKDIKWASTLVHRETGAHVVAQRMPCVAYEAIIYVLANRGLLDQYEVQGKQFNYPTINELEGKPARVSILKPSAPEKKPEKKQSLFEKVMKYFHNAF